MKSAENYFFLLFAIIPISIIFGPSISLINILLIVILFIGYSIYHREISYFSIIEIKLLLFLYLYLIFNSLISLDFFIGFKRNFGFIRFVILFIAINYFFYKFENFDRIFKFWSLIILIFSIDIYIERLTGANMFGFGKEYINGIRQSYGPRVVSFFKNEPIAGTFVYSFYFLILGYLSNYNKDFNFKNKIIILIIAVVILVSILLTGERSTSIKAFIGFTIFYYLYKEFTPKTKIFTSLILIFSITLIYINSSYLQYRYGKQLFAVVFSKIFKENFAKYYDPNDRDLIKDNLYLNLYKSGYGVFKDYKLFGVGNKNYRVASCEAKYDPADEFLCITHPHQIYFELLSEHGLIGTIIIISIIFYLLFKILNSIILSKNYLQIGCFIYILLTFTPALPGGSFFNDFNATLFWLNFSIMYAYNKKTNIFFNKKN